MFKNGQRFFDLYSKTLLIREVELRIAEEYPKGEMRCPTHLSIGQEAASVGVCATLSPGDKIFLGHRCHAGYLAKGGDLNAMIAELYGRSTGCAGGWGGSMHLVDESAGVMGTSAIVGSSISVATGYAYSQKLSNSPYMTAVFFGDSGPESGQLYESMNFAVLHSLPLLYVCEDNLYSTQTPLNQRQPNRSSFPFLMVAKSMGVLPFEVRDRSGADFVYDMTEKAREWITRNKGPALLYIHTYRYRTHVGPEYDWDMGYRTQAEVSYYEKFDPLNAMESQILVGLGGQEKVDQVKEEVKIRIDEAFEFAKNSPWPEEM